MVVNGITTSGNKEIREITSVGHTHDIEGSTDSAGILEKHNGCRYTMEKTLFRPTGKDREGCEGSAGSDGILAANDGCRYTVEKTLVRPTGVTRDGCEGDGGIVEKQDMQADAVIVKFGEGCDFGGSLEVGLVVVEDREDDLQRNFDISGCTCRHRTKDNNDERLPDVCRSCCYYCCGKGGVGREERWRAEGVRRVGRAHSSAHEQRKDRSLPTLVISTLLPHLSNIFRLSNISRFSLIPPPYHLTTSPNLLPFNNQYYFNFRLIVLLLLFLLVPLLMLSLSSCLLLPILLVSLLPLRSTPARRGSLLPAPLSFLLAALLAGLLGKEGLGAEAISLAPVSWNSSNPMFKTSKNDHVIEVKLYDDIDFVCPYYPASSLAGSHHVTTKGGLASGRGSVPAGGQHHHDSSSHVEQYIIYMVSKEEYDDCNIYSESSARMVLNCSNPHHHHHQRKRFTILFEPFQSIPNVPEFKPEATYYYMTTSTGRSDGLNNLYQGACRHHNMKLSVRVCCSATTTSANQPMKPSPSASGLSGGGLVPASPLFPRRSATSSPTPRSGASLTRHPVHPSRYTVYSHPPPAGDRHKMEGAARGARDKNRVYPVLSTHRPPHASSSSSLLSSSSSSFAKHRDESAMLTTTSSSLGSRDVIMSPDNDDDLRAAVLISPARLESPYSHLSSTATRSLLTTTTITTTTTISLLLIYLVVTLITANHILLTSCTLSTR